MSAETITNIQEKQIAPWAQALTAAEPKFIELSSNHPGVNWKAEANFARQILQNNEYLAKCDQKSIRDSVINLGAIGLTLNPALKECYLVPRGGKCVLDVSYTGMIRLATDTGCVEFIRADAVYENDSFTYNGPSAKAQHTTDKPFDIKARGPIVGFYAEAKLTSGEWMTEIVPMHEIDQIRKASKAKSGPWVEYFTEMAKKASIKRLFKTLPKTSNDSRLAETIRVINEHEGSEETASWQPAYTQDEYQKFHEAIEGAKAIDFYCMSKDFSEAAWIDLFASFPSGQKVKGKELAKKLEASGRDVLEQAANGLRERFEADDEQGGFELIDCSESELKHLLSFCSNECAEWARGIKL